MGGIELAIGKSTHFLFTLKDKYLALPFQLDSLKGAFDFDLFVGQFNDVPITLPWTVRDQDPVPDLHRVRLEYQLFHNTSHFYLLAAKNLYTTRA